LQHKTAAVESFRPIPLSAYRQEFRHNRVPGRDEFEALNDEDQRRHVMRFSTDVGKWYSTKSNGGMNRYDRSVPSLLTQYCRSACRYSNILPYDKNRVVLKTPIAGCDYVNASWVTSNANFVAAQGPLPHTVQHFLQAIVENDVQLVVMLTRTEEMKPNGKECGQSVDNIVHVQNPGNLVPKCEQYWQAAGSDKPRMFGSVQVRTLLEEDVADVTGVVKRNCQVTTGTIQQFET
jgi:protein tyrosine phosphatase